MERDENNHGSRKNGKRKIPWNVQFLGVSKLDISWNLPFSDAGELAEVAEVAELAETKTWNETGIRLEWGWNKIGMRVE